MLTVRVYGADRLRHAIQRTRRGLHDLSGAWRRIGARLEDTAVPLTPVLTGRLVASLRTDVTRSSVTFSSGLVYAPVQNYGWPARNIQARHFFDRAVTANREGMPGEVMSAVEDVARRAGLM